jgi:hypothetical protein
MAAGPARENASQSRDNGMLLAEKGFQIQAALSMPHVMRIFRERGGRPKGLQQNNARPAERYFDNH